MSKQLFNERLNRIIETSNHKEPDRVPILGMIDTWAVSYANSTIQECLDDRQKALTDVFAKPFEDIYFDANLQVPLDRDMKFFEIVGSNSYFISSDGTTIQHDEGYTMEPSEYQELINDPETFLIQNYLPKKYPGLTIEKLVKGMEQLFENSQQDERALAYFEDVLGLPIMLNMTGPYAYPPLDIIFDYLRGFKGTSIDLRRNPKELAEALEVIFPWSLGMLSLDENPPQMDAYPFCSTMMHIPTFINHKQFQKFFVPGYEKLINRAHAAGKKLFIYLEGEWEKHYDWLNSLPKDFVIALVEHDDFIEAKKKIGKNITIVGGMPLEMLKFGTEQKCIDYAKRIVDECAPGGGFIFSNDKCLLSAGDVKAENLKAVNQFVHEYGVYN